MKKKLLILFSALVLTFALSAPVMAGKKTKGLVISGGGYTWLMGRLEGTHSNGKFTSANIDYTYVYPLIKSKKKAITTFTKSKISGYIQGTVGDTTQKATGTITI